MESKLWELIQRVKTQSPLVLNLTNYVVMNNTANALLAAGASPIMAHARPELRDMVAISSAVVINIGTLDEYWSDCMYTAAREANAAGKPWVLDPVGAGASNFRNEVCAALLGYRPSLIRGNASEIMALSGISNAGTKGVDSTAASNEAQGAAYSLAATYGSAVCISGATDIITNGSDTLYLRNGDPMMTKVTGLGCTASALCGAFLGVSDEPLTATAAAMSMLAIAGELAAAASNGPGSLQAQLLDALYTLDEATFLQRLNISSHA
ncbi:hydroxyethylthiazole kinase [Rurimicrobium arvi]|uniref:Hydroxyethylthiazole kinase n=1 Tax=Rurimicrobium arvi TaxID=2049916 RepID=A0ABP8MSX3_9BACT